MEMLKRKAVGLLRSAERYTKTDMVYLAKGGFWLSFAQAAAALSALGLSIIVDRYLDKEVYGSYKYVMSVLAIFGALTITGIGTIVIREVARGKDSVVRWAFATSARWALIPTIATLLFAGYTYTTGAHALAAAFAIAALVFPLSNAAGVYQSYFAGKKDFKRSSTYWITANIFTVVSIGVSMLVFGTVPAIVATATIVGALSSYVAYRIATRTIATHVSADSDTDADNHASHEGFAWHLSGLNILSTASANVDKIVVFHFLGPVAAATYVFAMAIPDQFRAIFKSAARIALPKLAERSYDEVRSTLPRKMASGVALAALAVIGYAFVAQYIYAFLFPSYIEAVAYSRVLAITSIFVFGQVAVATFQAHGKTGNLYRYSAVADGMQIVVSVSLVPIFGLWGAVWSAVVGRGVAFIYSIVLLRRA
jgi:O-antigen/teichoic acid export membrane protein